MHRSCPPPKKRKRFLKHFLTFQQPLGDMAVLLPESRKLKLDEPEQTEAFPEIFDEMITRISKYQAYRKQVSERSFMKQFLEIEQWKSFTSN